MIYKIKKLLIKFYRFLNNEYILIDENSIKKPLASKSKYLEIFHEAIQNKHTIIDKIQKEAGFDLEKNWLNDLALHTQIIIKKSKINFQHGRLLYSYLRNYMKTCNKNDVIKILETGTAKGFSSICMSKALNDSNMKGEIYTIDQLPHDREMFWNLIDDHEKKKTRNELLSKWPRELKNIKFLKGETQKILSNLNLGRINFAFLDAEHTFEAVISEYRYVEKNQKKGDIIFFDDVTPTLFPNLCLALKKIENEKKYTIKYLNISDQRGYAIAKKEQ